MLASHRFILTVVCVDRVGVVAEVAGYLRDHNLFVEESTQYGDLDTGTFFMRMVFSTDNTGFTRAQFSKGFGPIAERLALNWDIHDTEVLPRVLIMVSKHDHCLNDLLYRYRTGALRMTIPVVVSNHLDLAPLVEANNIPFVHIPISKDTRAEAEARLRETIAETKADLVVLARYMQILSPELSRELDGRCINIHHSFLPSFKGARPYHKAYERGVKLIGATAHYVTDDLDEGPIIEQSVERVDHTYSPKELTAVGRDLESQTLARALKYHLEHRVFRNGLKTVVFR